MKHELLGFLLSVLVRLLGVTLRIQYTGNTSFFLGPAAEEPRIVTFWHDQQVCMAWIHYGLMRKRNPRLWAALISQHGDGRIAASCVRHLGIDSIAGSSTRDGTRALIQLIKSLREGRYVAITPDGPRGPRHEAKPGVVLLAQRSGSKIVPVGLQASSAYYFRSWDRMFVPKPFSKVVLHFGESISVPKKLSESEVFAHCQDVSAALDEVTNIALEQARN